MIHASEPGVEPLVAERHGAVVVAVGGREQRQPGAFGAGGSAAVLGGEAVQGLALPLRDEVVQPLGDADRGVVVADLGLVVPEHGQPAVAAEAVPADLQHLADAAAGDDGDLPHVPQAAVVRIVDLGEPTQVVLVGQRAGDLVGERAARGSAGGGPGGGHGDDELAAQADPVGRAGVHRVAQHLAQGVEHHRPGHGGDDAGLPAGLLDRQRGQAVAFAAALIGDEPAHVLTVQHAGVVPAAGRVHLQECAQFHCRPADSVDDAAGAGTARRLQQGGQVIPDQVAQPALRDAGQIDVAGAMGNRTPK